MLYHCAFTSSIGFYGPCIGSVSISETDRDIIARVHLIRLDELNVTHKNIFVFDRDSHSHPFGHWFACEFRYPDDFLLVENVGVLLRYTVFCYSNLYRFVEMAIISNSGSDNSF